MNREVERTEREPTRLKLVHDIFKLLDLSHLKVHQHVAKFEHLGAQLFEIAAACRAKGIDPESVLRRYTQNVVDILEEA